MDCRCFMFDLVILNISLDDFDYEANTLTIEVNFNNTQFTIESNPDKPCEFKQGRTCEFKAYPEDLEFDLLDNPLKLKVLANGEEIKGDAEFIWPQEMLEKLKRPGFVTYSNFDECDLLVNRFVSGKISVQYRLRAKCELSESEDEIVEKNDLQHELKRIVEPNDLFCLIQSGSDVCNGLDDAATRRTDNRATALDLSKFKRFNGKIIKDLGQFDQVYTLDCCHTKKDPVCDRKSTFPCFNNCKPINFQKPPFSPAKYLAPKSSTNFACKASQHIQKCPHSNKFSSEETETCSCGFSQISAQSNSDNSSMKNKKMHKCPQSPPILKETVIQRPRFCPICKNDVAWVPKLAACPKCGHKPTPYTVERPYNENMTADQILAEWVVDSPQPKNFCDKTTDDCPKRNRCACKNGKVCPYCRIRKICKDVLRTKKCHGPYDEPLDLLKDKSATKLCKSFKSNSGNGSRTHLAKVFSELQDLYQLKPVVHKHEFKENEKWEKHFAGSKSLIPKKKEIGTQKKQENLPKNSLTEAKTKLCGKILYNYKSIRKYPGTSIGHKTCVYSGKIVPGNMGWLWTANTAGCRSGWKPGAIRKPIREIMKYFLKDFPADTLNVSRRGRHGKKKISNRISEELIQKPTLHICKKNGAYIITMRPIKDATLLRSCADPYVRMKPIQFKIVKNPLKACATEIKSYLKKTFNKCVCRKPIAECFCRTFLDKKRLEYELNKACRQRGVPNLKNSLILSDTSDSETEFEFGVTPPAGVIKPQLKNKPDFACRETQYNENDWILKPVIPKPLNKYMKAFDATGGRLLPAGKRCPPVSSAVRRENTRKLPLSGIVGGWGGVGGNSGAGRKPLFCNLARRGKAETCYQPPCMLSCMPFC